MAALRILSLISSISLCLVLIEAPPVVDQKTAEGNDRQGDNDDIEDAGFVNLEYERYIQEVVQVLEADTVFRAKLEKASPDDIKSGKIAEELDFLHHDVRSKLHEAKRREVDRLRVALREQMERESGVDNLVLPGHLDHINIETFEKEDLRLLIVKASKDLEEVDKKRRDEYKEHEMKKEIEFRQKLAKMTTEEERQKAIKEREEVKQRHDKHPDMKHPGSKAQLEEVWEKVDNLPKDSFEPRTFFNLHDLSGDGYLDVSELEALFVKQVDKVYDKDNADDDMRQRDEELARMREHVMKEVDTNHDGLISMQEFLDDSSKPDFTEDEGWDTVDKQKVYTDEDLNAYAEQLAKASGLAAAGQVYPPYGGYPQQQDQQYPPHMVGQPTAGQQQGQPPPPGQFQQQQATPPQQAQQFQQPQGQQFQQQVPQAAQFQQQLPQGQQFQQPMIPAQAPQFQQQPPPPAQAAQFQQGQQFQQPLQQGQAPQFQQQIPQGQVQQQPPPPQGQFQQQPPPPPPQFQQQQPPPPPPPQFQQQQPPPPPPPPQFQQQQQQQQPPPPQGQQFQQQQPPPPQGQAQGQNNFGQPPPQKLPAVGAPPPSVPLQPNIPPIGQQQMAAAAA